MKTLNLLLLLVLLHILNGITASAAPTAACMAYYKFDLPALPKVTQVTDRNRNDVWTLDAEILKEHYETLSGGLKKLLVPERWLPMVKNNPYVRFRYEEKTFERKTITGEKYNVSYHILQPQSGIYKSTIVLQHGFAESATYFRSITKILVAMGFRVIAMDGANSGNTLLRTLLSKKSELTAPSPVEDGLALADILRVELKGDDKFILLGHSRGFAVTSLALSTGIFDDRLIEHIGSNGYDVWKVDSFLDKKIANPFRFFWGFDYFSNFFVNQLKTLARKQTNAISEQVLYTKVAEHIEAKSDEIVGLELAELKSKFYLTQVTMKIADGLAGADRSQPGFSILPFYNPRSHFHDYDNGFGLTDTNGSYKLHHLSKAVKDKTTLVFGDEDPLIVYKKGDQNSDSTPIVEQITKTPILLEKDTETGVAATHFLPSERPFDLIEIILKAFKASKNQK